MKKILPWLFAVLVLSACGEGQDANSKDADTSRSNTIPTPPPGISDTANKNSDTSMNQGTPNRPADTTRQ